MSVCKWLIFINIIMFLLMGFFDPSGFILTSQGIWYTLITSIFIHANFQHLFGNMFILWIFSNFEEVIGKKNYLCIYFVAGLMGSIFSLYFGMVPTVGASGAIMGIIAASLINTIKEQKYLIKIQKLKKSAINITYVFITIMILFLFIPNSDQGINNVAHISGFITGAIVYCIIENKEKWYVKKYEEFIKDLEEKVIKQLKENL